MLQQTPRSTTTELPSLVIVPPKVADVEVIFNAPDVVRLGMYTGGSVLVLLHAESRRKIDKAVIDFIMELVCAGTTVKLRKYILEFSA